jgi:hypothetical protein
MRLFRNRTLRLTRDGTRVAFSLVVGDPSTQVARRPRFVFAPLRHSRCGFSTRLAVCMLAALCCPQNENIVWLLAGSNLYRSAAGGATAAVAFSARRIRRVGCRWVPRLEN